MSQNFGIHAMLDFSYISNKKVMLLLFLLITASLFSEKVNAAAGDVIQSVATIDYVFGGLPLSSVATAEFDEDRLINFVVTENNGGLATPVIANMTDAVLTFTVTNTGNGVQDFLLRADNTSPNPYGFPADNFNISIGAANPQTFVESTIPANGYLNGADSAIFIDELAPNESRVVYVVTDMPLGIGLGDVSAIALIVQVASGGALGVSGAFINADDNGRISPAGLFSHEAINMPAGVSNTVIDDAASEQIVFNDPAGLNAEDISSDANQDVVGNGQHSDVGAYQVASPVVITKSVEILDSLGNVTQPNPGATLRYRLNVQVNGSLPVQNLVIEDAIPANTTYTAQSIILNGVAQTDIIDAPGTDFSRTIGLPVTDIEIDLSENGNVSVGSAAINVITFEVTID